jgi:hypothetical protein
MKVTHYISPKNLQKKETDSVNFMLASRKGDYLWLGDFPRSRYEGWFCRIDKRMWKIIESIEVLGGGAVKEIINGFSYIERKRENIEEFFSISETSHALFYELNVEKQVEIFFDIRESYSSDSLNDYNFKRQGGAFILQFNSSFFLAIKADKVERVDKKIERHYEYDRQRNSPPFNKEIFCGVSLYGKKFSFGVGETEKEALEEIEKIKVKEVLSEKEGVDYNCARKSLTGLVMEDDVGMYAGLPWFFHFWPRDEAISLKSVIEIDPEKGKEIYFKLLDNGLKKGPGGVVNIDAVGWLFKRTEDVLPFTDIEEKERIRRRLKKYMEEFLWTSTEDGFLTNKPYETWMDSLKRDGARIEIQAMKLNMYKTAKILAKRKNEKEFYEKMEKKTAEKVRKVFFDGENLYDGYFPREKRLEKVIRPNVFIAAYIYPELLQKKDWLVCFENTLLSLWLPWGGLSTLEKKSEMFQEEHTGEVSESYHQGDSWFFLNNLAAIVLYHFDKRKFQYYIEKIMQASKEDILWRGTVGFHAELSSAKEQRSQGCVNQAWSSAIYLEAKKYIRY